METELDSLGLPRFKSGSTEKVVSISHFVIALLMLVLQFLIMPFETWYRTTGFSVPAFIVIIGLIIRAQPSANWERDHLLEYISKKVPVSDSDRHKYLHFSRDSKIVVLVWGWCIILPFQILWSTFVSLGAYAMLGQFSLFPLFASFAVIGIGPCLSLLVRVRYRDIEHMLAVHRSWSKSVSKDYLTRRKN